MKDGGPAFPYCPSSEGLQPHEGMTLRDWFAGQALVEICHETASDLKEVAMRAYELADAMLKARALNCPVSP